MTALEQEPNETHPLSCGCWDSEQCNCPPGSPLGGQDPVPGDRPQCGTPWGYQMHRRAGEDACAACREAHATAARIRRTGSADRRQPVPCGTDGAYRRHRRARQVADQACLDAHAAAEAARRARRLGELREAGAA